MHWTQWLGTRHSAVQSPAESSGSIDTAAGITMIGALCGLFQRRIPLNRVGALVGERISTFVSTRISPFVSTGISTFLNAFLQVYARCAEWPVMMIKFRGKRSTSGLLEESLRKRLVDSSLVCSTGELSSLLCPTGGLSSLVYPLLEGL